MKMTWLARNNKITLEAHWQANGKAIRWADFKIGSLEAVAVASPWLNDPPKKEIVRYITKYIFIANSQEELHI